MDRQVKSCPNSHTASAHRPPWDIPVVILWVFDLIAVAALLFGITRLVRWTVYQIGAHRSSSAATDVFFLARTLAMQGPSSRAPATLANCVIPGLGGPVFAGLPGGGAAGARFCIFALGAQSRRRSRDSSPSPPPVAYFEELPIRHASTT
jgi:hypothetical protein